MKKLLLGAVCAMSIIPATVKAQEGCGTGRYNTEYFDDYELTSDIVYGNNAQGAGNLLLDFYEPANDPIAQRPLIILVHGGSFIGGSKTDDPAVTEHCIRFAKMGYATASINYTLGFDQFPPQQESAARTVYRAARELKTAVRFFRKDAATDNLYKINPNVIFFGGNSAGAITALHAAYLDQYSELPAGIDTSALAQGNMEGTAFGHPGYSSQVSGVINMAGAIGDTAWMDNNHIIPVVSAHGDDDGTVPYGSETIVFLGAFPVLPVDGSGSIDQYTTNNGMNADLLIFPGDDHCPWNSNATKMTQVINHNRDFLYNILCVLADIEENPSMEMNVFPNPSAGTFSIQVPQQEEMLSFTMVDITGKTVLSGKQSAANGIISVSAENLNSGVYYFRVQLGNKSQTEKLVIQK
ncbi:MAG: T9SS type A sorting domain-containing protein [Flavobacteriales bacterium]|nr:T9SS type A sorting domain-containing protein [Flavobacteriales bacterium]